MPEAGGTRSLRRVLRSASAGEWLVRRMCVRGVIGSMQTLGLGSLKGARKPPFRWWAFPPARAAASSIRGDPKPRQPCIVTLGPGRPARHQVTQGASSRGRGRFTRPIRARLARSHRWRRCMARPRGRAANRRRAIRPCRLCATRRGRMATTCGSCAAWWRLRTEGDPRMEMARCGPTLGTLGLAALWAWPAPRCRWRTVVQDSGYCSEAVQRDGRVVRQRPHLHGMAVTRARSMPPLCNPAVPAVHCAPHPRASAL
jgi:hypothetical protein